MDKLSALADYSFQTSRVFGRFAEFTVALKYRDMKLTPTV